MPDDTVLREHLIQLLHEGHAHATFDQAVRGFPINHAGTRPSGSPHSAWELLEHLRIAQNDILQFCLSAEYASPKWPEGYWPASPAPEGERQWRDSVRSFRDDLGAFEALVRDPERDLYQPFPWGDGQTLLREAMLIADHNSYHLGQFLFVRRMLGEWKD
ncbi:MAG TPA: DinB family protein [Bryobacteraceae bacterium]